MKLISEIVEQSQCLKITENVAYQFLNFGIFFTNFCPINIDLSGNTI